MSATCGSFTSRAGEKGPPSCHSKFETPKDAEVCEVQETGNQKATARETWEALGGPGRAIPARGD